MRAAGLHDFEPGHIIILNVLYRHKLYDFARFQVLNRHLAVKGESPAGWTVTLLGNPWQTREHEDCK